MKSFPRINEKRGKLTIVDQRSVQKTNRNRLEVDCICECGNTITRMYSSLQEGHCSSCGCDKSTVYNTKQYKIRVHMKASCDNPNYHSYARRGGKGITYPEKRKTFSGRREDQKDNYSEEKYFVRKNVFKNYSKENCSRETAYNVSKLDLF